MYAWLFRRSRFCLLVAGLFFNGCWLSLGEPLEPASPEAEFTFEHYEVVTDSAMRLTVLTGFFLGSEVAEVATLKIDENDDRRLLIHAFNGDTWGPRIHATLRPEVLFVDVVAIGERDRLITYEPGHLNWFDPDSASETELLALTSNFDPPRSGEIPHVDITQDVNGDGRIDLVLPDVDGFWVATQMNGGRFADPLKIGGSADMSRIYGSDGYRYDPWSQSRIHGIDYNHDGRSDLVFWNEDHFEVHVQDERGLFAPEAKMFTTEVAFDSDDRSWLATGEMQGKVLHSLGDLNGDGVGDLIIYSLEGGRVSKKRSKYEVHFGARAADGGTAFALEAGRSFHSEGRIQIGFLRRDFDGDGQVDLMFTTIERRFLKGGLWKSLKGFMGGGILLNLEFYRNEEGRYPDEPNANRELGLIGASDHRSPGWVPLDFVLRGGTHERRRTQKGWPRAFNKNLLIGDVNGDGRTDLLLEKTFRGLDISAGVPERDLFAGRTQGVPVVVPIDGEYSWLVDINRDGKQDVLMHHPFTLRDVHGTPMLPPGTEPHRITVLISR